MLQKEELLPFITRIKQLSLLQEVLRVLVAISFLLSRAVGDRYRRTRLDCPLR